MQVELIDAAPDAYETFYEAHVDEFSRFLIRVLGRAAEGRGGRISVADTLQEAMLRIYQRWPDLRRADSDERRRRLYRLLRDAAGEALRREHGRVGNSLDGVRVLAFDFGRLDDGCADLTAGDRELTVAVLGQMARDIARATDEEARRGVLDRAVFLAGLRALSEQEAVVLIGCDHLGWDQLALADRLGLPPSKVYETLFYARKLFYGICRHAVGIELDDEERARLHAYRSGELKGRDRRLARRHLQHCKACQAFEREQRVFGETAQHILTPLPIVVGGGALAREAVVKPPSALSGATHGLLAQAGATKALGATVAVLAAGAGVAAWASLGYEQSHHAAAHPPHSGAVWVRGEPPKRAIMSQPRTYASTSRHVHRRLRHRHPAAHHPSAARHASPGRSSVTRTTAPSASPPAGTTHQSTPSARTPGGAFAPL